MLRKFSVGELIHHKLFDYRGVIVGIDDTFARTDVWYQQVARTRPPKDQPWYHVLVDGALHRTYVAERNLDWDNSVAPVINPEVPLFFDLFRNGIYSNTAGLN